VPDRGTAAPKRSYEAVGALVAILILGLAFRLIIAYVLLPGSGFGSDRSSFEGWANDLATGGPFGFYDRASFIDYTPGYLYVLWLGGLFVQAIGGVGFDLIKLPAMLSDVVVAWLIHSIVRELGGSRRAALIGATLFLINPVTWFDSAIWGQVDSVGVIFVLLSVRDLWRRRPERASFWAVVAAIVKPQLGILVPIIAVVLLRRHIYDWLRPAGPTAADEDPAVERPAGPTGDRWFDRLGLGPVRLVTSASIGFLTAIVLCIPFGLSFVGLLQQVAKAAGGYPFITVNAYNPWALITRGGNGLAENGYWLRDVVGVKAGEDATLILGIPALYVGTGLLLVAIAVVCLVVARYARRSSLVIDGGLPDGPVRVLVDDRRLLIVALAVMALIFFVAPTRVHERYIFPAFAFGAILAAGSVRWRLAYGLLAAASFANLYAVLLTPYFDNPGIKDWLGMAEAIRSPLGVTLVVVGHVAVFIWALSELRPGAIRRLDTEALVDAHWERFEDSPAIGAASGRAPTAAAWDLEPGPSLGTPPGGPPISAPSAPPDPGLAPTSTPATGRTGLPLPFGLGAIRALQPDRSRRLHGETGGRFDRLDIWLLIVIVVAALVLRTFRLSEPYRMHFDEVYHARTATEFLQDWRYGQRHDIYEFTHPHLAKYAMAVGLVVAGDDRVTGQVSLGMPVRDVAVADRYEDATLPGGHGGDRFYVAGGDQVRGYDLTTRKHVVTWDVPGAAAFGLDPVGRRGFIGTDDGTLLVIDAAAALSAESGSDPDTPSDVEPTELANVGAPITRIVLTEDGKTLAVATSDGSVVSVDPDSGEILATTPLAGVVDLADGGTGSALTADPASVTDHAAAAKALAAITGGDAAEYERRLAAPTAEGAQAVILGGFAEDLRDTLDAAIGDARLEGFAITSLPRIAASGPTGVSFIDPATGEITDVVETDAARGMAKVTGIDKPSLYVALADKQVAVVLLGQSDGKERPRRDTTFKVPGDVRKVLYDEPTGLVHVLGTAQDGPDDTIYVIEPHANATFADARIPFRTQAWALDASGSYPSSDRQDILAASADGSLVSVDTGDHAFAWRLPGVIAGALMAGIVFILVRMLFRRREIAVIAAFLVLVDGMLFVQSRIAMNDVYVGLFIMAAYTLFAPLWTGRWRRPWAFWLVLPMVGILLGLALASKWIGLYAIAGMAVLILGRSALGRMVLILGLILGTTVLGLMAMSVPSGATSNGNLFFVGLMIALTLGAVLVTVLHPIAWSTEETRLALVGPAAIGILVFLVSVPLGAATKAFTIGSMAVTPVEVSLALILASGGVWLLMRLAAMWGFGPLAPPPEPDDPIRLLEGAAPAPDGWLRPGAMLGLPIVWAVVCLAAIPLAVYVISYLPWLALGNRLTESWPPGNTGQTLLDLTRSMYDYHNGLRATHAASSPFWAWPLDLKPVWFYQDSFAGNTAAAIYDAGNMIAWWLSIPAMIFVAAQAFRRRSLALGLVFVAFAFQWMPWARIDRATFQYHYYAAVPFLLIALAYFIAELRNGPSPRTWMLARFTAALAVLGPALMWLLKGPLCAYVRVEAVNPGSQACVATAPGQIVLTWRTAGIIGVLLVAGVLLVIQLLRLDAPTRTRGETGRRLVWIGLTALSGVIALAVAGAVMPDKPILSQDGFRIEPIALVVLIALAPVAWVVATARDARRFAAGMVIVCLVWFVAWYPNLAALPLPAAIVNAYQGLLPTYLYAFQFPVNTDPVTPFHLFGSAQLLGLNVPAAPILFAALLLTCVVVGWSAWTWRLSMAEREADAADPGSLATGGQAG
jgi:4-amino-4-deoxy-L-arabinose transferase-like glycosyltransferase